MDVSITNGLEGVRQYFQRLPATSNSSENLVNTHHPPPITSNYTTEQSKSWQGSNNNLATTAVSPSISQNDKTELSLSSSSCSHQTNSLTASNNFLENTPETKSTSSNSTTLLNSYHQTFTESSAKNHEQKDTTTNSISLPKHEMRPHNHDIWKVSHEQRLPNINDLSKNVNDEHKQNEISPNTTTTSNNSDNNTNTPSCSNQLPNEPVIIKSETANKIDSSSSENKSTFSQYQQYNNSTQSVQSYDPLPQVSNETKIDMKLYNDISHSSNTETSISSICEVKSSSITETPTLIKTETHDTIKTSENLTTSIPSQIESIKTSPSNEQTTIDMFSQNLNKEHMQSQLQTDPVRPSSLTENNRLSIDDELTRLPSLESNNKPTHIEQLRPSSHEEQLKPSLHDEQMKSPSYGEHIKLYSCTEQTKPIFLAEETKFPSNGESVRPSSSSGQMNIPFHTEQTKLTSPIIRPPSHGDQMRPPSHGDQTRPPSHGDQLRPPSHGEQVRPPTYSDQLRLPSHGDPTRPPSHGEQVRPPSYSDQMRPHGDQMRPPSHGDPVRPPSHGETMRPPSHGDPMRPPSLGDPMRPPSHGDPMRPPSHGDPMRPPSHGDPMRPPSHGEPMRPPSHGDQMRPPSHGDQMRPPSHGDQIRPPSHGDPMRPPSHGDAVRPQSHGDPGRPPSHGDPVRPPSHGDPMRPPSHGNLIRPPSRGDQIRPPSSEQIKLAYHVDQVMKTLSNSDQLKPQIYGEQIRFPSINEQVKPQHGGQIRPPSHGELVRPSYREHMKSPYGEQVRPSYYGDQIRPAFGEYTRQSSQTEPLRTPFHGDQTRSSLSGEQMRPPSHGEQIRPPSHGEQMRPPSHGEQMRPSSHGEQMRPPSHGDQMRPPSHGEQIRPPSHGEQMRPPSHGEQMRPPSHGEQMRPPSHGEQMRPPSHGGLVRPPSQGDQIKSLHYKEPIKSPSNGDQVKSHTYAEQFKTLQYAEQIRLSAQNEHFKSTSQGEYFKPSPQGEQIRPSIQNEPVRLPHYGITQESMKSYYGEHVRIPSSGEQINPSSRGPLNYMEQIRPSSRGDSTRSVSYGETIKAQPHGDIIRPQLHEELVRASFHKDQAKIQGQTSFTESHKSTYAQQVKHPFHYNQTRSSVNGEQFRTLSHEEQMKLAFHKDQIKSFSQSDQQKYTLQPGQIKSSHYGNQLNYQQHSVNQTRDIPSSDIKVSSSHQMKQQIYQEIKQTYDKKLLASDTRSHDMSIPQQIRSIELRPSSYDMNSVSLDNKSSHDVKTMKQETKVSAQEYKNTLINYSPHIKSQEFRSVSNDNQTSIQNISKIYANNSKIPHNSTASQLLKDSQLPSNINQPVNDLRNPYVYRSNSLNEAKASSDNVKSNDLKFQFHNEIKYTNQNLKKPFYDVTTNPNSKLQINEVASLYHNSKYDNTIGINEKNRKQSINDIQNYSMNIHSYNIQQAELNKQTIGVKTEYEPKTITENKSVVCERAPSVEIIETIPPASKSSQDLRTGVENISRPDRNYALYPPNKQILKQERLNSIQANNYQNIKGVSLPFHDIQASFNDIQAIDKMKTLNHSISEPTSQSFQTAHVASTRYDVKNTTPSNDKNIENKLKDVKNLSSDIKLQEQYASYPNLNQRPVYPTNTPYSQSTQSHYNHIPQTTSGSLTTNQHMYYSSHDKRLNSSHLTTSQPQEYQQVLTKTSQNSTEKSIPYSRSYNYASSNQIPSSQTYNAQEQQHYSVKSNPQLQDAQEKQRLPYNQYQVMPNPSNSSQYNTNYQPRVETSSKTSTVASYRSQHPISQPPPQQNYQNNPHYTSTSRSYYPTTVSSNKSQNFDPANTQTSQHEVPPSSQMTQYMPYPSTTNAGQYPSQQYLPVKSSQYQQYSSNSNINSSTSQSYQKTTHNLPTTNLTPANYMTQKSGKELHKSPSRQKHANQNVNSYTNTPHLAFKTTNNVPPKSTYKYPTHINSTAINQYYSNNNNGQNYSYINTTAHMSNYTNTTSVVSSVQASTVSTNSSMQSYQYTKSGLQDNFKRQQAIPPQVQSKPVPLQTQTNIPSKPTIESHNNISTKIDNVNTAKVRRDSPLDLSVKTVRTSADSTADDDVQIIEHRPSHPNVLPHTSTANPGINMNHYSMNNQRPSTSRNPVVASAPRVDFSPNFSSSQLTQPQLRFSVPNQKTSTTTESVPYTNKQMSAPDYNQSNVTNKKFDNRTAYYQNYHNQRYASVPSQNTARPADPANINKTTSSLPKVDFPPTNQSQKMMSNSYPQMNVKDINRKRQSEVDPLASPSKIARVDSWRQSIDQQIEQRFLSYTNSRLQEEKQKEQQQPPTIQNIVKPPLINGHSVPNTYPLPPNEESNVYQRSHSQPVTEPIHYPQPYISNSTIPYQQSQNIPQTHQIPYHPPTEPSGIISPNIPYNKSPQKPENPNQTTPSNTGADKRVLNILRNSIINNAKEAQKKFDVEPVVKPMDVTVHPQQPPEQHQPATDSVTPVPVENQSPLPMSNTVLEYSTTTPSKFHIPRNTELNKYETNSPTESKSPLISPQSSNENITVENSVAPTTQTSSTTSATADLDGLAANLAARIRTKAELKQLHSTQFNKINNENNEEDVSTSVNTEESEKSTINANNTISNPPKLTKEKVPILPPRRRLFSRNEEDGNSSIPHRNSTLRSSSETSIFDFRESDSESEMPVLERQSLDDMRRDRKSLSKPPSTTNLAADLEVVVKNEPTESPDPFFTETCDKFLEQLRTGGSSSKKRGRKKKVVEPEIIAKLENAMKNHQQLIEVEIKVEKCDDIIIKTEKIEPIESVEQTKPTEPTETDDVKIIEEKIDTTIIKEEDSDSDVPLIRKRNSTPNNKKIESDSEDDDDICLAKKRREKIGAKIKLQSSTESSESETENADSNKETETVADRLKQRKCRSTEKRSDSENSMNLRSREITPQKNRSRSLPQKKPFGDGSDFRPGWEEEVYRYKQSLRMPAQLINISRPSRISTSLPDLDPCPSPTASSITDNEFFTQKPSFMKNLFGSSKIKREFDSDLDSNSSFSLMHNKNVDDSEDATCSSILSSTSKITSNQKENSNSIVDVLAQRYGKNKRKKTKKTDNTPKIIPKSSNTLELLPTPSLDSNSKDDTKDLKRGRKPKNKNDSDKTLINNSNSSLLESFRKSTVNNFRNAFRKNTFNEQFTPVIFKSRTRKEAQILKKRATIREVFGEERPASAPPMTNHEQLPKVTAPAPKKKKTVNTKISSKSKRDNIPGRAGLRSALVLRGNRSVIRTKHQIMKPNKKRLMKSLATKKKLKSEATDKKLSNLNLDIKKNLKEITKEQKLSKTAKSDIKSEHKTVIKSEIKTDEKLDIKQEVKQEKGDDDTLSELSSVPVKRKYKLKSMRRKFSSGFDYIRKKKKQVKKENTETEPKVRKRGIVQRASAESVQDIQREIKGWVLNKGIGETQLHRAARLGYTDVIAYCLETLNSPPSPRDNAGYTPLHEACSRGHLDIAKLLLLYGANVHESAQGGIRPLHEASENGFVEIIRLLLSYGADPLLATYSGHTPLSLATDPDAVDVLQNYLSDVQGKEAPLWNFPGPSTCFHIKEEGYDALEGAPDPDPKNTNIEIEFEICDMSLPNLYTLTSEDPQDKWVLLQDLTNLLKVKSKEALLRQLNSTSTNSTTVPQNNNKTSGIVKEMKMADFLDQAHCCTLLSAGERINIRASKIALVKYTERVKELLGVEHFLLSPSKS